MKIAPQDIAFDFDGVVADTFRLFVHLAHAEYGIEINYEDITAYEFLNVIKMDKEISDRIVEQLTDRPHELDLKPNKGATRMLTRFAEFSPILFVTARPSGGPVALWCEKTMPHLLSSIHIEATGESTAKLPVLKERGVRYFVEDRLDTCHLLAEAGIIPIVYKQPWNREPHPFAVVRDWDDIAEMIAWERSDQAGPASS
jgi:hypothetical protein